MAAKNGSKAIFVKCRQYTLQIPCRLKILSKSLHLEPFPRCVLAFYVQVRNFVEITLSLMVSQINVFCVSCRNSRWPPKNSREIDFCKMSTVDCADTLEVQNFVKIALSLTVSQINAEIQDSCQKWRESNFLRKVASRLCIYPGGQKVSKINALLHFTQ